MNELQTACCRISDKICTMISWLQHLIGWFISVFRSREDLILENLALRQQLLALRARRSSRPWAKLVLLPVTTSLGSRTSPRLSTRSSRNSAEREPAVLVPGVQLLLDKVPKYVTSSCVPRHSFCLEAEVQRSCKIRKPRKGG